MDIHKSRLAAAVFYPTSLSEVQQIPEGETSDKVNCTGLDVPWRMIVDEVACCHIRDATDRV